MVYKCFVYGCKSHKFPKNTTFGIPKDPELRMKWAISLRPYSNGKELQSKHRVCKAHFRAEEIECYYNHLIQGTEVKIERGRPELKKGAIPSVFPGQKKPRRILVYKNEDKEKKEQSILLLNGEWVHVKKPEELVEPTYKRTKRAKVSKPSTTPVKNENSNLELQQENSTESLDGATGAKFVLITGEIRKDTEINDSPDPVIDHLESEILPTSALPPVKHADKEISSVCINWDALPLPEEIGSLLCDSTVPHVSSSSDFHVQSPKFHLPLKTQPSPPEDHPTEQLSQSDENLSSADNITEGPVKEGIEANYVLSFQGLLLGISDVQLPSPMWGSHTDHTRVYFSCMSYTGCIAVPKVEKIVMYQGGMIPRVFLRGIEVGTLVSERKSTSLEDVEVVLSQVDKLKLCLGIDCAGDIVSYSSDCDIFVESGRLPRCSTCRKQRSVEYSKKRFLETDDPKISPRPPNKKQSSTK